MAWLWLVGGAAEASPRWRPVRVALVAREGSGAPCGRRKVGTAACSRWTLCVPRCRPAAFIEKQHLMPNVHIGSAARSRWPSKENKLAEFTNDGLATVKSSEWARIFYIISYRFARPVIRHLVLGGGSDPSLVVLGRRVNKLVRLQRLLPLRGVHVVVIKTAANSETARRSRTRSRSSLLVS